MHGVAQSDGDFVVCIIVFANDLTSPEIGILRSLEILDPGILEFLDRNISNSEIFGISDFLDLTFFEIFDL